MLWLDVAEMRNSVKPEGISNIIIPQSLSVKDSKHIRGTQK